MAILIYNEPETSYPLAVMDATDITAYRTSAASAVASRYLARKNPQPYPHHKRWRGARCF
jgi:alanine dehydrogenase